MTKTRIAIPTPTSFDLAYNRANFPDYAAAVDEAGGVAVEVDLSLGDAEVARLARSCAGILLPGSPADVDPARFGQERAPETAPADPDRERVDRLLIEDAYYAMKPLLGICFGMQMLNVDHGGTLVQHVLPVPVNHSAGKSVAIAHDVTLDSASLLADWMQVEPSPGLVAVSVNSSHHQAVGVVGRFLKVTARCPQDGVVEALEGTGQNYLVGVQWHPERSRSMPAARALFRSFVREASFHQDEADRISAGLAPHDAAR
jgi:putative glutamine amidotransferase